ncbi:uncharacterized protein LOC109545681 [Dendroctonus ponderosae]
MNENVLLDQVLDFYSQNDWRKVLRLNETSECKEARKLLWAWPSEDNMLFLKKALEEYGLKGVASMGCGCGLLEWIIQQFTGLPVVGYEVNRQWWESKYSIPSFIPLEYVDSDQLNVDGLIPQDFALMFCYFNDGRAFREYVQRFRGLMIIIIGPDDGSGRHTDPQPFTADFGQSGWMLVRQQEIKNTKDFIAIYLRNPA